MIPAPAVDEGENDSAATIRNLQQHCAITLVRVLRAESREVGRALDLAIFQVHCVAQIDDPLIVRVGLSQREVNASADLLIRSRVAECLAVQNVSSGRYLDPDDPRGERRYTKTENERYKNCATPQPHGRKHTTPNFKHL